MNGGVMQRHAAKKGTSRGDVSPREWGWICERIGVAGGLDFAKRRRYRAQTLDLHGRRRPAAFSFPAATTSLFEQLIERVVAAKPFELDLDAQVIRAVRVDERLLEADLALFVKL
jgi:hypothetical protein